MRSSGISTQAVAMCYQKALERQTQTPAMLVIFAAHGSTLSCHICQVDLQRFAFDLQRLDSLQEHFIAIPLP